MDVKPYVEVVMRAIPREHWDDVFYKNAATLFKLEVPAPQESQGDTK